MNPVLTLTHNNLALTKRCVESIRSQDISTRLFVFDNGSGDGTSDWLVEQGFDGMAHPENKGVSYGWNVGLSFVFEGEVNHCLVIGSDTVLPPWFYRTLLSVEIPFVTGVAVDSMEQAFQNPDIKPFTPNPDFSAFLIRREAWETIGPFDENMKLYCSDCDLHIRGHKLGVPMMKASVPFYHERSSTLRLAPAEERTQLEAQANNDRAVFYQKWGCVPGTKQYEDLFREAL